MVKKNLPKATDLNIKNVINHLEWIDKFITSEFGELTFTQLQKGYIRMFGSNAEDHLIPTP